MDYKIEGCLVSEGRLQNWRVLSEWG